MITNKKTTKTRFQCLESVETTCGSRKEKEIDAYFHKHLKNIGFIWDKKTWDIYKDFNYQINLNEGDTIDMEPFCGHQTISHKYYDVTNDIIVYTTETI